MELESPNASTRILALVDACNSLFDFSPNGTYRLGGTARQTSRAFKARKVRLLLPETLLYNVWVLWVCGRRVDLLKWDDGITCSMQ